MEVSIVESEGRVIPSETETTGWLAELASSMIGSLVASWSEGAELESFEVDQLRA